LVSAEILELLPPHAFVVNVGKRCGGRHMSQEATNALLVSYASDGLTVVRLKGGDPMIFGRAGEEMDALRAAGIPFEVVPGITAALGAAAAAQVPLTDRRSASSVTFLTGHHCASRGDHLPRAPRRDGETLALYMPGSDRAGVAADLLSRGWGQNTPCLIVSRATQPSQQTLRTTLADLPHAPAFPAPCILFVGSVVAHHTAGGIARELPYAFAGPPEGL